MAPGKNGYRVVMPVFDARERRLEAARRRFNRDLALAPWAICLFAGVIVGLSFFHVF